MAPRRASPVASPIVRLRTALATLLVPSSALAGPFELAGAGAEAVAEAGARGAQATDASALHYNPGGLAFGGPGSLTLTPTWLGSALWAGARATPVADPFGVSVLGDVTLPLKGILKDRIHLGVALFVPEGGILHVTAPPPDAPQLPYFGNRSQRLVILPGLAVRLPGNGGVGVGVNFLGGVDGVAILERGPTGAREPRIDIDAGATATVNAGFRFVLGSNVRIHGTFRGPFGVPAKLVTRADVGGVPLDVTVGVRDALFDPATFVAGTSVDLGRLRLSLDVSYALWSAYKGPAVEVASTLPGVSLASAPPDAAFRDVASARGAVSYAVDLFRRSELAVRGGLSGEPTILKLPQTGLAQGSTRYVDGAKLGVGVGATLVLRDFVPKPLRFGFGLGATFVESTRVARPDRALQGGGHTTTLAWDVGVDL